MTESYYPLPPPPPPQKSSRKKMTAAIVIVALVVAVVIGVYLLTSSGNSPRTPPTGTPTPTPTSPPSFTQSPSPTATPTSAQTSSPYILSETEYVTASGYFKIVGEVKNTLGTNIQSVEITATFYYSNDTVAGTTFSYTEIDILKPNQKSPFILSGFFDETTPARYELSIDYIATQEQPFEGLTILSQSASIDSSGYHKVVGEVKNNGFTKAKMVKVVGTYYDSAGKVIGVSFTYVETGDFNVGETSPYELSSSPVVISPASYELQVEGLKSTT